MCFIWICQETNFYENINDSDHEIKLFIFIYKYFQSYVTFFDLRPLIFIYLLISRQ